MFDKEKNLEENAGDEYKTNPSESGMPRVRGGEVLPIGSGGYSSTSLSHSRCMKDAFYFPHDSNATQDPKMMMLLSECGLSGVGIYWILVEILHQQEDGKIPFDSFIGFTKFYYSFDSTRGQHMLNKIQQVLISSGLLLKDGEFITSSRVIKNKKYRKSISELRSKAGKKSASLRSKATHVEQNPTSVELGKERKGNEMKGNTNTPLPPEGEILSKEIYSQLFLEFWNAYPRKEGKGKAWNSWKKIKNKPEQDTIINAVALCVASEQWKRDGGQFIPHPATWINQRRWEDEIFKPKTQEIKNPFKPA